MIESRLLESGITKIAGVDEAGRGACAGPLVVAAVMLRDIHEVKLEQVRDSKELTPTTREELFEVITQQALEYSIIEIPASEIDEIGLHNANLEGMRRAISALAIEPEYVLTDGYQIPGLRCESLAIWKGDQVAISISAASILAKVYRDRIMIKVDTLYPGYHFAQHKGYVTRDHERSLIELGVTQIHRKSYANISALINK
ncbi:MAG: ribonuclease HII [Actinobacteria bacterium]|nr:ribonuclease HII [Actinomycetota bacterium]